jgi:hypothetical protein
MILVVSGGPSLQRTRNLPQVPFNNCGGCSSAIVKSFAAERSPRILYCFFFRAKGADHGKTWDR